MDYNSFVRSTLVNFRGEDDIPAYFGCLKNIILDNLQVARNPQQYPLQYPRQQQELIKPKPQPNDIQENQRPTPKNFMITQQQASIPPEYSEEESAISEKTEDSDIQHISPISKQNIPSPPSKPILEIRKNNQIYTHRSESDNEDSDKYAYPRPKQELIKPQNLVQEFSSNSESESEDADSDSEISSHHNYSENISPVSKPPRMGSKSPASPLTSDDSNHNFDVDDMNFSPIKTAPRQAPPPKPTKVYKSNPSDDYLSFCTNIVHNAFDEYWPNIETSVCRIKPKSSILELVQKGNYPKLYAKLTKIYQSSKNLPKFERVHNDVPSADEEEDFSEF